MLTKSLGQFKNRYTASIASKLGGMETVFFPSSYYSNRLRIMESVLTNAVGLVGAVKATYNQILLNSRNLDGHPASKIPSLAYYPEDDPHLIKII